jgi:hypothetical protein
MIRLLLATVLVSAVAWPGVAEACRCLPPTIDSSFTNSDAALSVRITSRVIRGGRITYNAVVLEAYKGCYAAGDMVTFTTSNSSASCGVTNLRVGASYLLFGTKDGTSLAIDTCDYNQLLRSLSEEDATWLDENAEGCSTAAAAPATRPPQVTCEG